MDLQAMFSDNQIAVMGCFAALAVCGAIAGLSFQFGPAGQKSTKKSSSPGIHSISSGMPEAQESDETRRAA